MKAWFARWQEFYGWMPILLVLSLVAWIALGAVGDRDDLIRWLLELPVKTLYAAAISGITYLVWRRWSYRMCDEQLKTYWDGLLAGHRGPVIVFLTNAAFYLCVFCSLLYFFS